ncbi:DMT family transporter [Chryseobacterium sp. WX]|uniref:DMT family transporter n=1 Tax=Chryseobacterium sp. WX TaxID=3031803 RepID=UPI00240A539D|nr:DMT family transporter [Chryseobacterium sp. WX]WFB68602.1 DMT family transporter [Chryseobacterium sp. WX]
MPVYLLYFKSDSIVPDLKNTAYLGVLSLFCTVGLYVMFAEVLKKIPAFTVNLTYNLEPVYAIIMAFLFFGESKEVNLSFYIGLVFIIASVVLQTVISIKKTK